MPLLKTLTLGCKVNQYETQFVREGLQRLGYRDAADDEAADLCIVNTCTVTNEGDAKSRQAIRRLHRRNPHARIVVMGCYATRAPEELAALPGVAEVITDKRELPDWLQRIGVVDVPDGISGFGNRHRAYVKVQDGCLLRCSYCIIPLVRPVPSSRDPESIEREVRRLVAGGYREIVLTGVHLGHYGVESNRRKPRSQWLRLSHLLARLVELSGDFRIRLSSIEATEVTRELIAVMADRPDRICPHVHICMQSGSDRVLRRMRRRWSAKMFVDRCRLLQERLDHPALTTDWMVGFPGETREDFLASCRVARDVGFAKMHIFPFSPRRGTPAAEMPDQLRPELKKEWAAEAAELERELRWAYWDSLVGRTLQVLAENRVEDPVPGWAGTACRYAPVVVSEEAAPMGSLVPVTVRDRDACGLRGETGSRAEIDMRPVP